MLNILNINLFDLLNPSRINEQLICNEYDIRDRFTYDLNLTSQTSSILGYNYYLYFYC